jgi:uncharacterized SAM-binding protein YcdF (DUF218 family)
VKKIILIVFVLILGAAAWFVTIAATIYLYAQKSDARPADAAIVLGAAAWDVRPSPVLRERINHAIQLYKDKQVKKLIFTGGKGHGASMAESEVALRYAIQEGVPRNAIHTEDVSETTYENLSEAQRIVEAEGYKRVLIVSDPFHLRRSISMARDLGLDAYPSPTRTSRFQTWKTKSIFLRHEVYTYTIYLLFGSTQP